MNSFMLCSSGLCYLYLEIVKDRIVDKSIFPSDFEPAWWLKNRHAQTMYPAFPWSGAPKIKLRSENLELPDGDITVVDWMDSGPDPDSGAPILIILHGNAGYIVWA